MKTKTALSLIPSRAPGSPSEAGGPSALTAACSLMSPAEVRPQQMGAELEPTGTSTNSHSPQLTSGRVSLVFDVLAPQSHARSRWTQGSPLRAASERCRV